MFLNSVRASNYSVLAALVCSRTPGELTYDELKNTFEVHLCPKENIVVSQHHFLSNYQAETQTIADYIATPRREITYCEFISPCKCHVSIADIFLHAQFVRGIRDNLICEQILESAIHAFDEIAKKAMALEAPKTDSRYLSKKSTTLSSANEEVNNVFKYRGTRRDDGNAQNRNYSTSRPRVKPK
jgi:hypothetical protein